MRRAIVVAATALCLLAVPVVANAATLAGNAPTSAGAAKPRAVAAQPPTWTGYFQCFNGSVFTDFTDPDGNDANMNVWMVVSVNSGDELGFWMNNSGPGTHGVFWYLNLRDVGIDPANVTHYDWIAQDESGAWSLWVTAPPDCKGART